MLTNAIKWIMLLGCFAFFVSSCASSKNSRTGQSRRSIELDSRKDLRKDITHFAKKFQGIKYKYAGKSPKTGFDCSGFTSFVYNEFDIAISPGSQAQAKTGRRIAPKFAKPGDLLFFGKHGKVNHVALITKVTREGIEVVHSTSSKGIMVQNVSKSSYWKPRILFARDILSK